MKRVLDKATRKLVPVQPKRVPPRPADVRLPSRELFVLTKEGLKPASAVPRQRNVGAAWPLVSTAAGVAPSQIAEAAAHLQAAGVPTEFTPDGDAILRDRHHRRRVLKALGMRDRDGGYSDG